VSVIKYMWLKRECFEWKLHPFYANKFFSYARVVFNVFKRKVFFFYVVTFINNSRTCGLIWAKVYTGDYCTNFYIYAIIPVGAALNSDFKKFPEFAGIIYTNCYCE